MTLTQDTPPLENGSRPTRMEFERHYHTMPDVKKANLTERTVYIAPPVRYKGHGEPHYNIMASLGFYTAYYIGVEIANNASVRFDIV